MTEGIAALAARGYFALCLALGRMLRSARYTKVQIVHRGDRALVRKRRRFYAPLLIRMSDVLVSVLDIGVRVLPQREWEERERRMYASLTRPPIDVDAGVLVLPLLEGRTLAALLEDAALTESARRKAIEHAVVALADLHRLGFTHADAMAENVLVDLEAGVARWFDFETVHDARRTMTWRRADDVRSLLVTCLARTVLEQRRNTLDLIVTTYADDGVTRVLAANYTSVWRRSLVYQLSQAPLPYEWFRAIGRWLHARAGSGPRDAF